MNTETITFPLLGENFALNPPKFITIFGFDLYLYGLFITSGFLLATVYLYIRHKKLELTRDNVLDLLIMAVPFGLIGARIYYIAFNASQYFGPGKWMNILSFREGGLAMYGGVIGGAVAFCIYSRIKKVPIGKLLDAAGFGLLIGQGVGRWGNFINREAHGGVTDLPWKMGLTTSTTVFPGLPENTVTTYVHPTFLYESLWCFLGLILMHIFSKKFKTRYHGQYFMFYVAWYGFGRFMIEGLRTDSLYIYGTDIRVSKLLAAISFSVATVLLVRNYLRNVRSANPVEAISDDHPPDETPDVSEA